jgi:Pyruvate/2-oxoacid:ferredoxin oxidoreductase delta subunit
MFGRLIVSICEAVQPAYTVVDGILGMEGQGPGKSGTPREIGMLVGGANVHAVDHAICTLVGMDPANLETLRNARAMGLFDGGARIEGPHAILTDFHLPELGALTQGPAFLGRLMRRYVIQQPVVDDQLCKQCGECWKYCPATAIHHTDHSITFDTEHCIRCYCCLEVCPHAAIRAEKPMAGKLFDWIRDRRALLDS